LTFGGATTTNRRVSALAILILQGDAEARLLKEAEATLQAGFPDCAVRVTNTWTTRSDFLGSDASSTPWIRGHQLLPTPGTKEVLEGSYDLVLLSVLADAVLSIQRTPDGGSFVPHRELVERWSAPQRAAIAADCVDGGLLGPTESANVLEPLIEELQHRGSAVAICNVFRHVSSETERRLGRTKSSLRERIRATNLNVTRLSRSTGCFVLDLDRALAHAGGTPLETDCFGGNGRAEELAMEELFALVLEAVPAVAGGGIT
jgi:hypothetical protein